jgi:hypothetical protein
MKNELPFEQNKNVRSLDQCFADKPHLRQRLLEISDMIGWSAMPNACSNYEPSEPMAIGKNIGFNSQTIDRRF